LDVLHVEEAVGKHNLSEIRGPVHRTVLGVARNVDAGYAHAVQRGRVHPKSDVHSENKSHPIQKRDEKVRERERALRARVP
jgi:hypothetical protein